MSSIKVIFSKFIAFYIYTHLYTILPETRISKIIIIRYKSKVCKWSHTKKAEQLFVLKSLHAKLTIQQVLRYTGKCKLHSLQKPTANTHRRRKFHQVLYSIQNIFNKGIHLLTEVKHKYITLLRSTFIFTGFKILYLSCEVRC